MNKQNPLAPLAKTIATRRRAMGISRDEMADKLYLTRERYIWMETGKIPFQERYLKIIAAELSTNLEELGKEVAGKIKKL